MNPIHEIAQYKLLPGTRAEALQQALRPLHAWVARQPGCLDIRSFLGEDGVTVTDVLAWRNREDAKTAMAATEHHQSLAGLMPLVEPDTFACAYGTLVLETRP
jgi:hypothetical protein